MMRCPKCGFNSFDHNLTCPKCRKDLSVIRRQLNLTMPAPSSIDFFQTAGNRSAFPEPVLGQDEYGAQDPFAAPPFAGTDPYAANSPFGGAGGAVGFDQGAQLPFGVQPLGMPQNGAAFIDDILPAEDDSIDDIAPIEDFEEITPVMAAPQQAFQQQVYQAPPQQVFQQPVYQAPPQAPAFPAPQAPAFAAPQAPPMPPSFGGQMGMPPMPQVTGAAALAPELADDEIEIELDSFDDPMASVQALPVDDFQPAAEPYQIQPQVPVQPQAPVYPSPAPDLFQPQALDAMNQIKNTLEETGDLTQHLNLDIPVNLDAPAGHNTPPSRFMAPDATLGPVNPAPAAMNPQVVAVDKEELSNLADEINLDDLDSEL